MKNGFFLVLAICTLLMSSCGSDDKTNLDLVFRLKYDGDPLVMFEDLEYPNGEILQMKRVSFYLSDINVADSNGTSTQVSEVEFIDLTDSHIDMVSAINGYNFTLEDLGIEDYNRVSFNIGLTDEQNATVPEDYNSDSPLSKSGEYWRSWQSYIYIKLEGHIDYNKNGITDSGEAFALHLGTDEIKREFATDVEDPDDFIIINIDVRDIFENDQGIYNIKDGSRLHNLDDPTIANMNFLADGFAGAVSTE